MRSPRNLLVLSTAILIVCESMATAYPDGNIDQSFGLDGTSRDHPYHGYGRVLQQPDGKLVIGGGLDDGPSSWSVYRLNPNGSLDVAFEATGFESQGGWTTWEYTRDVAIQADGKIVSAGEIFCFCGDGRRIALARHNADGSLDSSFGDGGTVQLSLFAGIPKVAGILLQPDNKIVLVGQLQDSTWKNFLVMRFNTDGSLDTGFGDSGKVVTRPAAGDSGGLGIVRQGSGKLVAMGYGYQNLAVYFALLRLNADGSIDTGFGSTGVVLTPVNGGVITPYGFYQLSDGKLIGAGGGDGILVLTAWNADGSVDYTFGGGGGATGHFVNSGTSYFRRLIEQDDGKLVAVGWAVDGGGKMVRFRHDGIKDTTFGSFGVVSSTEDFVDVVQQADTRLIATQTGNGVTRYLSQPLASCPPVNTGNCRVALKTSLTIKDSATDTKDKLAWKWGKAKRPLESSLVAPYNLTNYFLCMYGAGGELRAGGESLLAGGMLRWSRSGDVFKYKDETASEGISSATLKASAVAGKSAALVKGGGVNMPDPPLPIFAEDFPLQIQLVNGDNGLCIGAEFNTYDVKSNRPDSFQAGYSH